MIKKTYLSLLFCGLVHLLFGQIEKASECLKLTKLTNSTYVHTCNYNNGLVYISGKEALIVSTPDSDTETQHLIDWVKNEKRAKIVGYVIDRWHPDAMEGLDVVHKNGIKTYAYELTRQIAKDKKLPIPKVGFKEKLTLLVGGQKVICHYLGAAHTRDGIVVWVLDEKVLFGGNEIRNKGGWLGNIADANLNEWSNTARRVKQHYGQAKFVIPGHGKHGGAELIDYTIGLYSFAKNVKCQRNFSSNALVNDTIHDFHFVAANKRSIPGKIIYLQGKVSLAKKGRKIEIQADSIQYNPVKKSLYVSKGCITQKYTTRTESFAFNKLYLNLREDEVALTLIIKDVR
ncbi:MAG TPA: hypothetical protein DCS93_43940 [Microscillaceae bacterium]|nr:hypothetical protein [Microscillaceae bacterium]